MQAEASTAGDDEAPTAARPVDVATVDDLGHLDDGITLLTATFGYLQRTDVPAMLASIPPAALESPIDLEQASYFLSTIDLVAGDHPSMPRWRTRLFLALTGLTTDAARAFELPGDRTVVIGSRVTV